MISERLINTIHTLNQAHLYPLRVRHVRHREIHLSYPRALVWAASSDNAYSAWEIREQ